ncbi:MAG: hypothetical protein VX566_00150, partial [Candidatus Thermoplasmatota archaeon]|nr:hypothetical protein [Candidatus Thermoplasmatota archaeon]
MEIKNRYTELSNSEVRYSITGGPSKTLVVLLQEPNSSKDVFDDLTINIVNQGFQVLSFDFNGKSQFNYLAEIDKDEMYAEQAAELISKFIPFEIERNINLIGNFSDGNVTEIVSNRLEHYNSLTMNMPSEISQVP